MKYSNHENKYEEMTLPIFNDLQIDVTNDRSQVDAKDGSPQVDTTNDSSQIGVANDASFKNFQNFETFDYVIATDGACLGNPGPGGWAWVDQIHGQEKSGGAAQTTNNIMELTAVIEALRYVPSQCSVLMRCDSQYVINTVTKWAKQWERNGWRTASKKPVANVEIVKELMALVKSRQAPTSWQWVRGHNGDTGNERADEIASAQAVRFRTGR